VRTRFVISTGLWDLLLLAVATQVASAVVFDQITPWSVDPPGAADTTIVPLLTTLLVGAILATFVTAGLSGPGIPRPSYGRGFAIVGLTLVFTAVVSFFVRGYYSRLFVGYTIGAWTALTTAHRIVRRRRPWTERLVVVTSEKHLADQLADSAHAELVDVIDPQTENDMQLLDPGTTLAVDMRAVLSDRVAQFVSSCDIAGYAVRPLASVYEEHTGRIPLVHLNEGWEITTPLIRTSVFLPGKRVVDILLTALTAPIWLPIMAVVALVVRVASPGPVIFSQRRIGLNGQPFTLHKFRTMRVGADEDGPRMASENDARIVRGGAFLRRSRLDELPQIWNVLRGEMSLVGPRAEQIPFVRQFRKRIPFYDQRHLVRPGITGWAQVNFKYAESTADTIDKLSFDLYYIKHMSPVLDVQILWKTIWTVLTAGGR
jgi:exopolysaccharide biosynthesis polyprenyl glycosylphosphotransferase